MNLDILVPATADGALAVTIASWLKNQGDPVKKGEDLAEATTEKITLYITAPADGKLESILVPAGAKANVGDVIAKMNSDGGH